MHAVRNYQKMKIAPFKNSFTPHYRRGCPRVLKLCIHKMEPLKKKSDTPPSSPLWYIWGVNYTFLPERDVIGFCNFACRAQLPKQYNCNLRKNTDNPPSTPHYDILMGELNISSWIRTSNFQLWFYKSIKIVKWNLAKSDPSPGLAKCYIFMFKVLW